MRRLRLALAGLGAIGRVHLDAIAARDDCLACAVADPAPAADSLGLPLYRDLGALLLAERPDGVILATPNAQHADGALECIAAGVPCLVEKPVADTLAAARHLAAAVQTSDVPVLVGHHRRHSAVLERAAGIVASGVLGRLVAVQASVLFTKPASYFLLAPWRAQAGGGPILINLVHEIDTLRWLAGEIVQVQALASNAVRGFAVEDSAAVGLRFANGALGSLLLSDCAASARSWEQTSGENPVYDHHADEACCLLVGTRGSVALPTLQMSTFEGEASWTAPLRRERLPAPAAADPLARQLAHFIDVIGGAAEPRVTVADATKTLAATLAVAEAARSGAIVELPG